MLGSSLTRALGAAIALLLCFASPASAQYQYVQGDDVLAPNDAVCPGIGLNSKAGYFRNETGRDPRVEEPFWVEIRLYFVESFDCAATWTGVDLTLPSGVVLDTGGGRRVACNRWSYNNGAADPRITANCPGVPSLIGGSTYALDPIATNHPEKSLFGRRWWFTGYDNVANNTYREMRLLVPVRATQALSGAPVTFGLKRFDSPTPWTSRAFVTTSNTQPPSGGGGFVAPKLSMQNGPGQYSVSAIGVEIPFSVSKGSGNYRLTEKNAIGASASGSQFPTSPAACAGGASNYEFTSDNSFLEVLGDFADFLFTDGTTCDLRPSTQYTVRICAQGEDTPGGEVAHVTPPCVDTTYTTLPVDVSASPTESETDARVVTYTPVLRGAWPAGAVEMKLAKPGQAMGGIGTNSGLARNKGTLTLNPQTRGDNVPWMVHSLQACFTPQGGTQACAPARNFVPGLISAPTPTVTANQATLTGVTVTTPNPSMVVQVRLKKAAEVTGLDPSSLPVGGVVSVPASASAGRFSVPEVVAQQLEPGTRYVYAVCVESTSDGTPEKCTPGSAFTTQVAPAGGGGGAGSGSGTGGTGTGSGGGTQLLPAATFELVKKIVARKLRRPRLKVGTVGCTAPPCEVKVTLKTTASVARALGLKVPRGAKSVTVARKTLTVKETTKLSLTITISKKLLARLKKGRKSRTFSVQTSATAGGRAPASRSGKLSIAPR